MSALAEYLRARGVRVTGCDAVRGVYAARLAAKGVEIGVPRLDDAFDDLPLVIVNSAIRRDDPSLTEAMAKGCDVARREEALGAVFNSFGKSVAVCGTHGKTTTAAMIVHGLMSAGLTPAAFVGGVMKETGGNFVDGKDICVAEACEYRAGFMTLKPDINCMLNVDYDHADFYSGKEAAARAFRDFAGNTKGVNIVCGDDGTLKTFGGVTFGMGEGNYYSARGVWGKKGYYTFTFTEGGKLCFTATLSVPGLHNVTNALCACAALRVLGLGHGEIKRAVETFTGVDRRFTVYKGRFSVVTDYAHHPAEIAAALKTAGEYGFGKIRLVFQPHTYTRTRALFGGFLKALDADEIYIVPTYAARENAIEGYESKDLADALKREGKTVFYFDDMAALAETLKRKSADGDAVMLVGAGDVDALKDMLV